MVRLNYAEPVIGIDSANGVTTPLPAPGDGQVAIKVRAAGVSLPDLLMIKGRHPLIKSTPFSPGIEVAGTVSAVGNGAPLLVMIE